MYLGLISCNISRIAVKIASSLALSVLIILPTQAEWTGGVEGGAVVRDGKTSNQLRLILQNDSRPLSHYIYAEWIRTDDDDSYEAGYRPRYWFSPALYGFGELTYRVDKPLNIDRETTEAIGVGYQLLANNAQSAYVELGAGARQVVFTDEQLEDVSQPFARARAGFSQTLADLLRLELETSVVSSETVTESQAEVGVAVNLGASAIKYGYRIIRLNYEGQDAITDDTQFVSLNYAF